MKKNVIAFMIVAALLVCMIPSAFAVVQPALTVTSSAETVAPGGTVTVTVSLTNNPGNVCGVVTLIASEGLTLTAVTSPVDDDLQVNLATGKVCYTATELTDATVVLFTATYSVSKTAAEGSYTVVASGEEFYTAAGANYAVANGSATIDVVAVTDVTVTKHAGSANINYTVAGNVVTVTHMLPCKVGYWSESQGKYVAVPAVASGDSYTFTVPEGVTDVILVVKGDATGDGIVNNNDVTRLKAITLGKFTAHTAENAFAAEVTGEGTLNNNDVTRLKAITLGKFAATW